MHEYNPPLPPSSGKMTAFQARQAREREVRKRLADAEDQARTGMSDDERARMIANVNVRVSDQVERERASFDRLHECQWCQRFPTFSKPGFGVDDPARLTAPILVSPAEYSPDGTKLLKPSRTAHACFECTRRLGLLLVDTKQLVKEREQASRIARAEQRARDRAEQTDLFPDERLHTDPIVNG